MWGQKVKISILKEQIKYKEIDFEKEIEGTQEFTCFFGRSDNCFVTLYDRKISREHIKLSFKENNWFVKEVSDNPLMIVNGIISNEFILKNNDVIELGPFRISIILEGDNVEIKDRVLEKEEEDKKEKNEVFETPYEEVKDNPDVEIEDNQAKEDSFETSFETDEDKNEYDSDDENSSDEGYSASDEEDNFDDQEDYNEMAEFSDPSSDDKTDPFGSFIRFELKIEGQFRYKINNLMLILAALPSAKSSMLSSAILLIGIWSWDATGKTRV